MPLIQSLLARTNHRQSRYRPTWSKLVCGLICLITTIFIYIDRTSLGPPESTTMTWMYPNYYQVPEYKLKPYFTTKSTDYKNHNVHSSLNYRYRLWRYAEGPIPTTPDWDLRDNQHQLNIIPVLFIHGNAGSPNQVRSLASVANEHAVRISKYSEQKATFRFYAVDYKEELNALHPRLLESQAVYLTKVYQYLSKHYDISHFPVIAHSMGAVVARIANIHPHHLMCLSVPFVAPIPWSRSMSRLYASISSNYPTISIHGGVADTHVPPSKSSTFAHLTVGSEALVQTTISHLIIVWCNPLMYAIIQGLVAAIEQSPVDQSEDKNYTSVLVDAYKTQWNLTQSNYTLLKHALVNPTIRHESRSSFLMQIPIKHNQSVLIHTPPTTFDPRKVYYGYLTNSPPLTTSENPGNVSNIPCTQWSATQVDLRCGQKSTCESRPVSISATSILWSIPIPPTNILSLDNVALHITVGPPTCNSVSIQWTEYNRGTLALTMMQVGPALMLIYVAGWLVIHHFGGSSKSWILAVLTIFPLLETRVHTPANFVWWTKVCIGVLAYGISQLLILFSFGLHKMSRSISSKTCRRVSTCLVFILLHVIALPVPLQWTSTVSLVGLLLILESNSSTSLRNVPIATTAVLVFAVLYKSLAIYASLCASVHIWRVVPIPILITEWWNNFIGSFFEFGASLHVVPIPILITEWWNDLVGSIMEFGK